MKSIISVFFTTFFLGIGLISFGQNVQAYAIYNSKGKKVSFEKMLKELAKQDIILFGELHNDPIAHWLQLKMTQELHKKGELSLGAEMLEADNQDELNQYLNSEIDYKAFDTLARLWMNHKTDYQPLVEFAKENNLPFIATNVPRRYASMVYKKGAESLDSLPENEKRWIAPLPFPFDPELPGYKAMLEMMGGHAGENFPKAQAIKDATMAHFIISHYIKNPHLFLHFNGAYHSNNYEGIYWYLNYYARNLLNNQPLKIGTISTVLQENVNKLVLENKGVADFILVVDKDMTTTY